MSLLVAINGQNYIIPEPNEVGWGSNLDDFFVAISNGVLQKTGGSFTLSAETDFGTTYGLKSAYYKSRASNVAATGAIRLANAETGIVWRNAAHDGDLALTVNSSNQLTFNGTPIESNALSSAHILVGNASNIATDVAMTGDISIDNAGVTAIGAGKIVNAQVNASAAIAYSKLALTGSIVNADIGASAAIALSKLAALGTAKALQSNAATGAIEVSSVTNTELGYVSGVTSALQTQLDAKMPKAGGTFTNDVTYASGKGMFWTDSGTNTVKLTAPTTITPSSYTLKWPAAQGGSNQYLTNDGSGNLSWTNAAGTGTVNSGTQYQLGYYATTTNAITGLTLITGSRALASDANGLPVAATTTATELGYVNGVTSAIQTQINTKAPIASPTFTGTATTPALVVSGSSGNTVAVNTDDLIVDSTNHRVNIGGATSTSGRTLNVSRAAGDNIFRLNAVTGSYTVQEFTENNATTAGQFWQLYKEPTTHKFAIENGTQRLTITAAGAVAIQGTTTNDNAGAGFVGETVLGNQTTLINFPTSTQWGDLTSISLTAGDWLVWGVYNLVNNAGTTTECSIAITTTTGNSTTGFTNGLNNFLYRAASLTSSNAVQLTVTALRFSLSAGATVYLKYEASWSTTAPQAFGNIRALRIR